MLFPLALPIVAVYYAPESAPHPSKSALRAANTITADGLKDYLTFIASDALQGRDTPSPGLDSAAQFIAFFLKRWGLRPAGDDGTYFQKIALSRVSYDYSKMALQVDGKALAFDEEFTLSGGSGQGTVSADALLLRVSTALPADADLTGKILVVYGQRREFDAAAYAKKNGAVGLVRLTQGPQDEWLSFLPSRQGRPGFRVGQTALGLPSIQLSPDASKALLEGAPTREDVPAPFPKKLSFTVAGEVEAVATQNIVAIWPGVDPKKSDEFVALGAHYDHIGVGRPDASGDRINNGADDDGSGTVSLLSIAESLARGKVATKRSILFVWHCGEEKGLWGSDYFTTKPTVPIDKIVTQLNIDMVGRSKPVGDDNPADANLSGPDGVYVIGSRMLSTQLGNIVDGVNGGFLKLQFDYRYDDPKDPNRFYYRSDHYNYARKGIPIAFWFDGVHADYHRPGDEVAKIDFSKMEKVARTVFLTAATIADLPERPKVDKPDKPAQ